MPWVDAGGFASFAREKVGSTQRMVKPNIPIIRLNRSKLFIAAIDRVACASQCSLKITMRQPETDDTSVLIDLFRNVCGHIDSAQREDEKR